MSMVVENFKKIDGTIKIILQNHENCANINSGKK